MLLWQRRNSDFFPGIIFLKRYFLGSVFCHIIVIFALFFLNKDKRHDFFLDLSKKNFSSAQVRLLPLSMERPTGAQLTGGKKGSKNSTLQFGQLAKRKKKVTKRPLTSVIQHKKDTTVKKASTTKSNKKTALKSVDFKKKNKSVENKEVKKEQFEAVKEEQKKPEKTAETVQETVEKEKPHEIVQDKVFIEDLAAPALSGSVEGQEYLYLNKNDLEAFTIAQKLRDCLFEVWSVPLGVPLSAVCEVVITIGWDGVIFATDFVKKSGILMYDLSVQETLEQVHFPHEMWGKQITVVFKP